MNILGAAWFAVAGVLLLAGALVGGAVGGMGVGFGAAMVLLPLADAFGLRP